ncbi:hypothetical protein ACJRO7_025128 [Eucalyptus globulus]|uniref:Uncharacterized protein n=1 Tax=Eucalyptus globulus TaxID=34317 RepID=A0ABD3K9W8_EUCGL
MDPFFEQRLREEVVYLHSLWHRGPPPNPPLSNHSSSRPIPISNPTPFKKQYSAPTKKKKKHQKHKTSEEPKQPEKEWPCESAKPITQPSLAWPMVKQKQPDSGQKSRYASAEKQAKIAGQLITFAKVGNSDGEEEEEDDDDGDGDDMEDDRVEGDNGSSEGSEEYKFMLDVFERNHESGDFWCFVCGAQGGKMSGRKFKNSSAVLQHSISISKTKKRRACRAFGLVICRVMGWDVERLPLIVAKGESSIHSLVGPSLSQLTVCEEDAATKSVENYEEEISIPGINRVGKADGPVREKLLFCSRCFFIIYIYFKGNMIRLLYICWDSVPLPTYSVEWPCGNFVDSSATSVLGSCTFISLSSCLVLTEVKGESKTWHQKVFQAYDLLDGDANGECEVIKFLMKLFMETAELRSYNESVYKDIDFCCLVCGGVGNKPWKWFKGCNGLLQHCTTTWKIKKLAKKAYARAICKVLDWDINCFPPIKNTSEAFGRCLVQSGDMQKIFMSINCPYANDSASTPASSIKWHGESPVDHSGNHSVLAEEKGELKAWHQKVLEACQAFFNCSSGSDSDGDDDEDVLHGDDYGECEIVKFFTMQLICFCFVISRSSILGLAEKRKICTGDMKALPRQNLSVCYFWSLNISS